MVEAEAVGTPEQPKVKWWRKVVDYVVKWFLIKTGLRDPDPKLLDFNEIIGILNDEEAWAALPKSEDYEYVPESEIDEEDKEPYPDMIAAEDRLAGCKVRGRIMPAGTSWTDKRTCTYYECKEYNQLTEISCPEGCYECHYQRCHEVPGDPDGEYPDCCPTVECEPPKFRNLTELLALGDQCKIARDCC